MGCESLHHQWKCYKKKIDERSHPGYFMGYAATTWVIIYWNLIQNFVIHRAHNVWFDEYTYRLSIEDNHTTASLLIQQDPESHVHNSDLINLIICELDIKSTKSCDTKILTYEIKWPPFVNKVGFILTGWSIIYNPIYHLYNTKFTIQLSTTNTG